MAQVRNISALGALDVPELGVIVGAGEVVEVPDERLEAFLEQTVNWAPADAQSSPKKESQKQSKSDVNDSASAEEN